VEATITNRLIGVEIEAVIPIIGAGQHQDVQQLLASVLSNHGLPAVARPYSHQPLPSGCLLVVEHDSSLRDESRFAGIRWAKIEIKTAPLPWPEIERILPPALEITNYLGARNNASTGLHVHVHLPEAVERPEVVRNLAHLWWRFHQVVYGLVAPSRQNNQYCRKPTQADATMFDHVRTYPRLTAKLARCDRYMGLNLTNLASDTRRTVEWRLHGGSTDWSKISAWILATQRWVEHAVARSCHYRPEPVSNTQAGLNALLISTGLKPNSRIYKRVDKPLRQAGRFLLRRWKHFNQPQQTKAKSEAA